MMIMMLIHHHYLQYSPPHESTQPSTHCHTRATQLVVPVATHKANQSMYYHEHCRCIATVLLCNLPQSLLLLPWQSLCPCLLTLYYYSIPNDWYDYALLPSSPCSPIIGLQTSTWHFWPTPDDEGSQTIAMPHDPIPLGHHLLIMSMAADLVNVNRRVSLPFVPMPVVAFE